ncbi:MAG: flagellar assembly protein FliW [Planctomycetota bacterium]
MKVQTSRFGEIEVPEESAIAFPEGIVGFKDCTRFVIFECGDEGVFKWLQSADRPEIAFVICEAHLIVPNYQVMIGEKERSLLKLQSLDDAVVCLILCIPTDPQEMTANLLGPIVFNAEERVGMQLVLVNPEYSTKHRVFDLPADGAEPAEGA